MLANFDYRVLADVDATLNGITLTLIMSGLIAVKTGRIELHKKLMLAAVTTSAAFLCCYIVYHLNAEPVRYAGEDWMRPFYFTLLISHIILAVVQVPLILVTVWLGLKDRRERHKKWARITAPIWLYVSITGVIVYFMLY